MSGLASAAVVASGLFGAALLLRPDLRRPFGPGGGHRNGRPHASSAAQPLPTGLAFRRRGPGASGGPAEDLQRASLLVAQISALLRAGRSPAQMWAQAAALNAQGSTQIPDAGAGKSSSRAPQWPRRRWGVFRGRATSSWDGASSKILASAAHAASLGRPVGAALRTAAQIVESSEDLPHGGGRRAAAVWRSVAACIDTAEASGSPLAAVLERLAAQFEADADAAAARAVALAGPKATAKVLSVLPLAGLGLGILMGVDPLGLLLSTPLGAGSLVAGVFLTLVGRWWSSRLVHSASEER